MIKTPLSRNQSGHKRPVQNRDEIENYIAQRPPAELNLAKEIISRLVIVGPVMIGLFALLKGGAGAIAAAFGSRIGGALLPRHGLDSVDDREGVSVDLLCRCTFRIFRASRAYRGDDGDPCQPVRCRSDRAWGHRGSHVRGAPDVGSRHI